MNDAPRAARQDDRFVSSATRFSTDSIEVVRSRTSRMLLWRPVTVQVASLPGLMNMNHVLQLLQLRDRPSIFLGPNNS